MQVTNAKLVEKIDDPDAPPNAVGLHFFKETITEGLEKTTIIKKVFTLKDGTTKVVSKKEKEGENPQVYEKEDYIGVDLGEEAINKTKRSSKKIEKLRIDDEEGNSGRLRAKTDRKGVKKNEKDFERGIMMHTSRHKKVEINYINKPPEDFKRCHETLMFSDDKVYDTKIYYLRDGKSIRVLKRPKYINYQ